MKKKFLMLLAVSLFALFLVACGDSAKLEDKDAKDKTEETSTTPKENAEYSDADMAEFQESVDRLIEDSNNVIVSITPDESGDWAKGVDVTVINDVKDMSEEDKQQIANDYGLHMAGKVRGLLYGADPDIKPFVTVYYQSGDVLARHDVLMKEMKLVN